MKNIKTSLIVDPGVQQPFIGPSLAFLQDATKEAISNVIIGMIGSTYSSSQVYILFGCVRTGALDGAGSGAAAVTAGAVFFNGEVYTVPAFSTANISGQTLYSDVVTTNPSPDPVKFSDGTLKNVHDVRQWVISQAASGSNAVSTWINSTWHTIGASGEPAFQNSWTLNTNPVKFKIDAAGFVCMEGIATGGNTGTTVFTLPVGYRPSASKRFAPASFGGSSADVTISISTSGNVTISYSSTPGTESIFLDCVRFSLD